MFRDLGFDLFGIWTLEIKNISIKEGRYVTFMEEHSNHMHSQHQFPKMTHSYYFHHYKQGFQRTLNLRNYICQVN